MSRLALDLPVEGRVASFDGATGWLNSEAVTAESLRGKVVLVDFWTYTCINWLRTLAYVRAWADRYEDQGLVVVGVHTPEFPFERDEDNIRRAVAEMGVRWPVAIDSDYAVWRAFSNSYWPAAYIADAEGQIRYHHFGEGAYDELEQAIQALLGVDADPVTVEPTGFEVQADWENLESPETYLGSEQGRNFVRSPDELRLNNWSLSGDGWTTERRASVLREPGGRLSFRFHARDVHLVMGPAERGAAVPFQVRLDGERPGVNHGFDVDENGDGTLSEQRLHQLIRRQGSIDDRTIEITFLEPGAEVYCFTFG
jgi:thiol-disulfide isomerase/thioredoxin